LLLNVNKIDDDIQKSSFGLAIGYIVFLLVCWVTVLVKIGSTKAKSVPSSFVEFYAGMKKQKWKVWIYNFFFIFLRILIPVLAVFIQHVTT